MARVPRAGPGGRWGETLASKMSTAPVPRKGQGRGGGVSELTYCVGAATSPEDTASAKATSLPETPGGGSSPPPSVDSQRRCSKGK